ncbi:MAG: type I methionyl aminopeptidase [Nitrospirae bacterium RBG_19FT_COMBO_42_15]|nr:MAG: type I methionyl aminopeptidase [Nitrospirae bacterium RBG_19FT_COMBO_42_15]
MIILKSQQEIAKMASAGRIVAEVLEGLKNLVKPGTTTLELDEFTEEFLRKKGAKPAFKGYRDYPATICASINNQVVHGIPSDKVVLKNGDIISIDIGAVIDGFYGDAAITLPVGDISTEASRLLKITEAALYEGIKMAVAGRRLSDISNAVQSCVEGNGYSVVRDFVGHGIGQSLHEEPQIPNFGRAGQGPRLKTGMTLAIEPMVNMGRCEIQILGDNWTAVTKDGSLSAHFEHTIVVTDNAPEILTKL